MSGNGRRPSKQARLSSPPPDDGGAQNDPIPPPPPPPSRPPPAPKPIPEPVLLEDINKLTPQEALEMLKAYPTELDRLNAEELRRVLTQRAAIISRIPEFWKRAIEGFEHPNMRLVSEQEKDCMKSLQNIEVANVVRMIDDGIKRVKSFHLIFTFGPNSYFTNLSLVMKYVLPEDQCFFSRIDATPIEWKPGMDLSGYTGEFSGPASTFFSWYCFKECMFPWMDNIIARKVFKDGVWKDPLKYYNFFFNPPPTDSDSDPSE